MNSTDYNDTVNEDFDDDNDTYGVVSKAPRGYIKEESRIAIEQEYIRCVVDLLTEQELMMIADCYGIAHDNSQLPTKAQIQKYLITLKSNECFKLIKNKCQCGKELKLNSVGDHYLDIDHVHNNEQIKYLQEYTRKNKTYLKCGVCTHRIFAKDAYSKIFEHMYHTHKIIQFPGLDEFYFNYYDAQVKHAGDVIKEKSRKNKDQNSEKETTSSFEELLESYKNKQNQRKQSRNNQKTTHQSVDWISKLKKTTSSQNYVSTVLKVLSLDELRVIAMCYGIHENKKHTADNLRRLLLNYNTEIVKNNNDCHKLYRNKCQCGDEIKLTHVLLHYHIKEHEYNEEPIHYLRHDGEKKIYTCNICNKKKFHFKEQDYAKAFEHMYKVHNMIMFPFLIEYDRSNKHKKAKIIQKYYRKLGKRTKNNPDYSQESMNNTVTEEPIETTDTVQQEIPTTPMQRKNKRKGKNPTKKTHEIIERVYSTRNEFDKDDNLIFKKLLKSYKNEQNEGHEESKSDFETSLNNVLKRSKNKKKTIGKKTYRVPQESKSDFEISMKDIKEDSEQPHHNLKPRIKWKNSIKEKKKRSEQKVKQFLQRNNLQTMPTFTRHDTVTVEPTDSATQEIQTTPTQRKHIKHLKKHALTELVKQQTKKFKKNNSKNKNNNTRSKSGGKSFRKFPNNDTVQRHNHNDETENYMTSHPNDHDENYINTVLSLMFTSDPSSKIHYKLSLISRCYGMNSKTTKGMLKDVMYKQNGEHDICVKIIRNKCRCGEEIEYSQLINHYVSKKHTHNKRKQYFLTNVKDTNELKCTLCNDAIFKEDDYKKIFKHMFYHDIITFPVLSFVSKYFEKPSKKLQLTHTETEIIKMKIKQFFNNQTKKRTRRSKLKEALHDDQLLGKDEDRSESVEIDLDIDGTGSQSKKIKKTRQKKSNVEQKTKRIKFDDLPIEEQQQIVKARRARKTQLQWEKRERDRKAAGKSPPKTRKEQNLKPEQLWNAFYDFVQSKGDIDPKNLYCYECYKKNKYKVIKKKNISEHYMKNHDNFKLTFEHHEIKKNDKNKLTNLILESDKYVYPNKSTTSNENHGAIFEMS